jgi:predicted acylesterase/phospholipase RssA
VIWRLERECSGKTERREGTFRGACPTSSRGRRRFAIPAARGPAPISSSASRSYGCAAAALLEKLPADLKISPEARFLGTAADRKVFNIVHLIYNARHYEGRSKDYEFSRASMEEHWRAGYHDVRRTLRHPEVLERPGDLEGLIIFDLLQDSRE